MIDEMRLERVVSAPAHECHALVADVENYPQWASDVISVDVLAHDDEGRPSEVAFRVDALGRTAGYTLAYDHSEAPRRISWHLLSGDIVRRLDGCYEFDAVPDDPAATTVGYHLELELAVPLPGFVKRRAESRIAHAALDDLAKRVESRTARDEVAG